MKGSVFEDNVVAFKEEDTPVEFSRATSLSSLTIDDEPKISNDAVLKVRFLPCFVVMHIMKMEAVINLMSSIFHSIANYAKKVKFSILINESLCDEDMGS